MKRDTLRAHLKRGGLIAYPTESCYGLGCDPLNPRAVRKLARLKGRPIGRGLILIADRFERFHSLIQPLRETDRLRVMAAWPGPVSWILPARRRAPWLRGGRAGLAVRVTAHPWAAQLCRDLGTALVSTSANKSGGHPVKTVRECRKIFGAQVWVLEGRIGKRKRPSTLIDLLTGKILRP
ncbi:MAG TPA: Sua5/YciO/YrdC/YwlC family protein [Thiobacillaceae bacterium]|nr:Sua5/YciO/YrdC/YwlC family protein [Thiobacillaceae bacterium]